MARGAWWATELDTTERLTHSSTCRFLSTGVFAEACAHRWIQNVGGGGPGAGTLLWPVIWSWSMNIMPAPVCWELRPLPTTEYYKAAPPTIGPGELFSRARSHSSPFTNQRVKPPVLLNWIWSLGSCTRQEDPSWGPARKGQWSQMQQWKLWEVAEGTTVMGPATFRLIDWWDDKESERGALHFRGLLSLSP